MVLRPVLIALPVALALGTVRPAGAEERMPDPARCENWTSVADQEAGKTLILKRIVMPIDDTLRGYVKIGRNTINGLFSIKSNISIAIISDEDKLEWSRTFAVSAGSFADFTSAKKEFRKPIGVSTGTFSAEDFDRVIRPLIEENRDPVIRCRQGDPRKMMSDVESDGSLTSSESPVSTKADIRGPFLRGRDGTMSSPAPGVPEETLPPKRPKPYFPSAKTESPAGGPPTEPAPPGLSDHFSEPLRLGDKLGVISPPARSELPKSPERRIGDHFAKLGEASPPPAVIDVPPDGGSDAVFSVCHADTQATLALARGTKPAAPTRVGLRNAQTQVEAYDFIAAVGDAVPMKSSASLADSTGKLLAYEPVGLPRRDAAGKNWVSVAGLDASRLKRAGSSLSGPVKRIRILVVGGAPEIAVSGLDKVETEMRRQTRDTLKLSLEWRAVGSSGRLTEAGRYESFEDLVKAAESKAAGRDSDVLEEAQLGLFIDGLQSLLEGETSVIDKVFWVKGAYKFPTTFPPRFERFVTAVSASPVVRKTPAGKPAKWLVALTADVPGFSVAYLQEVVYSQEIGDVLKEDRSSLGTPRRLVPDPAGLAARLLAGTPPAVPTALSEEPATGGPVGRLVVEAGAVFEQRGHLVSRDTVERLRMALDKTRMSLLMADATGKSPVAGLPDASELVAALLRSEPDPAVPRWPRLLPDWTQKLSPTPGPAERQAVEAFLQQYRAGLEKLADATRLRRCGLVFVPDTMLFPF